jgi:hypothetical protein
MMSAKWPHVAKSTNSGSYRGRHSISDPLAWLWALEFVEPDELVLMFDLPQIQFRSYRRRLCRTGRSAIFVGWPLGAMLRRAVLIARHDDPPLRDRRPESVESCCGSGKMWNVGS